MQAAHLGRPEKVEPVLSWLLYGTVTQLARGNCVAGSSPACSTTRGSNPAPPHEYLLFLLTARKVREVPGMDGVSSCRGRSYGSARVRRWFDSSRIHHLREQASFSPSFCSPLCPETGSARSECSPRSGRGRRLLYHVVETVQGFRNAVSLFTPMGLVGKAPTVKGGRVGSNPAIGSKTQSWQSAGAKATWPQAVSPSPRQQGPIPWQLEGLLYGEVVHNAKRSHDRVTAGRNETMTKICKYTLHIFLQR